MSAAAVLKQQARTRALLSCPVLQKTIAYRAHARSAACEHKHMQLKDCCADS
jgi:hypothetical protein